MKLKTHFVGQLLALVFAATPIASQESKPQPPPRLGRPVHLVYNDAALPDTAREELVKVLVDEPKAVWTSITVDSEDISYYKLVERRYNISSLTLGRKRVANKIIAAIKEANNVVGDKLTAGSHFIIPPIPRHTYNWDEAPAHIIRVSPVGSDTMRVATTMADISPDNRPLPQERERSALVTAKELSAEGVARLVQRAWDNPAQPVLPAGIHVFEEGGDIRLIMSANAPSGCDTNEDWLRDSPFASDLKHRLAAVFGDAAATAELIARAKKRQLVIIDWVRSPENHGRKVESVVRYFLSSVGVPTALPVELMDLNPANNQTKLQSIFEEFKSQYFCNKSGIQCEGEQAFSEIRRTEAWIANALEQSGKITSVPQLLFEAVLWKYFRSQSAWVNMSFSIDAQVLDIMQADFLAASQSFGIAAASDAHAPDGPTALPQRAASVYPNFVNVTYGTHLGAVLGGTSNTFTNMMVTALAQGCGFEFGEIKKTDEGTSFAAPFVAAATWMKYLIDGTSELNMRKALIHASFVSNELKRAEIESAGPFDAARLLLGGNGFVMLNGGTLLRPNSLKLTLKYKKESGGNITEEFVAGEVTTVSFLNRDLKLIARIRKPRTPPPPLPVCDTQDFEVVEGTLITVDDTGSHLWDLQQSHIRTITF